MSGTIELDLRLSYPGFRLEARASLPGVGVTGLFGHSGSGKTTLLRCIAGLERGIEGRISVTGEQWLDSATGLDLPTHRRAVGYVFQETALFPHLTVRANLIYGWRRTPPPQRRQPPEQVIDILGLGGLLERYPHRLSGGERQRVAIGRALLNSPRLLLMDEPMAALDRPRRGEILPYLERLHAEASIPILYVTHDLEELVRIADHLVLIEGGRILQAGPMEALFSDPGLPISREEDAGALISALIEAHDPDYHLTRLGFRGGKLTVGRIDRPVGTELRLRIHAKDVSLALTPPAQTSILNVVECLISDLSPQGEGRFIVRLDAGGTPLLARITRKSVDKLDLKPGLPVYAQIKSVALHA